MSENLSHWLERSSSNQVLLQRVHEFVKTDGRITEEHRNQLAKEFKIAPAVITGVLSAYDFLKSENAEKKVFICNGSSCLCAGRQDAVKEKLQVSFTEQQIGHVSCVGRCHENGSFLYQDQTYSGDDYKNFKPIAQKKDDGRKVHEASFSKNEILTANAPEKLEEIFSIIQKIEKDKFLGEVIKSKLRGRGGAGFPFGLKLESFLKSAIQFPEKKKYIVCNADEGDPGAFTDKYLLDKQAHLVLWGMAACGIISGAEKGYIYLRYEYPETAVKLQKVIDKIAAFISPFKIEIVRGLGSYVCGEETALINSLEGQRPEVRVRPPYPTVEGLFASPTLLSNVETFANLFYIWKNGGEKFAQIGHVKSSGTKLLSLDGGFKNPGVYEVDMGTSLDFIIEKIGGGFVKSTKALHVGGPLGGIIPVETLRKLTLDFDSFSENGFLLGHASFVCIPEGFSMIDYVLHLFEFVKDESCGKCYPCRLGSDAGFKMWNDFKLDHKKISLEFHTRLLQTLEIGSLCALGGGLPLPVRNALQYFKSEFNDCFIDEKGMG
jgi:NADH-quinone oxidoreductase subunit F